jgi:predicted amidophosphoribosyltransferase
MARKAFNHLFSVRIERALADLAHRNRVRKVVLAPLRIARLLSLDWHPHVTFLAAVRRLHARGFSMEVEVPWRLLGSRQAARAAEERRREVALWEADGPNAGLELSKEGAILVIDDVLTSGQTALRLATHLRRRAEHAGAPIIYFSLLRTPADSLLGDIQEALVENP